MFDLFKREKQEVIGFAWRVGMLPNRTGGGGGFDCSIKYIFEHIEKVAKEDGTIYLRKKDFDCDPDFKGACQLEIEMIDGDYYMMLLYYEDDGDSNVRTFMNADRSGERVYFNKDYVGGSFLCNDLSIVKEACRQFVETGDVSRDILD